MTTTTDQYERQQELVPAAMLEDLTVNVIGVGAIGRQVAMQLAMIGVRRAVLFDDDIVDVVNLPTQGYSPKDVNKSKVHVTCADMWELHPEMDVIALPSRYRPRYLAEIDIPGDVATFCCVDSIDARRAIWRSMSNIADFWVDGRMLGEVIKVLAVEDDPKTRQYYPTTLFAQSEAVVGRCTARSTIYAATIAAGLMVHQFTRWLRGIPVDKETTLNLLAGEWDVT